VQILLLPSVRDLQSPDLFDISDSVDTNPVAASASTSRNDQLKTKSPEKTFAQPSCSRLNEEFNNSNKRKSRPSGEQTSDKQTSPKEPTSFKKRRVNDNEDTVDGNEELENKVGKVNLTLILRLGS